MTGATDQLLATFDPLDQRALAFVFGISSLPTIRSPEGGQLRLCRQASEFWKMQNTEKQPFFQSSVRFDPQRIRAAAVYCSDGRFGDQFDELMHKALELPRYDRLAVPGGAACLASHFATYREEEGVVEQLRFLIDVHALERVVLIAHEACAFYTHRLQVSPLQLESRQREDMKKAVGRVRSIGPNLLVDAFFAHTTWDGATQFESVEL